MPQIPSYPHILNFGHRLSAQVVGQAVVAEEKVDGSQFSFAQLEGALHARSKGRQIDIEAPDAMFREAVETARSLYEAGALREGWVYRGEVLSKPKHNTLTYDRTPRGGIVLFDVETDFGYLSYMDKVNEATRLGLEVVPRLFQGVIDVTTFGQLLREESFLGGPKIEGVVLKPLDTVFVQIGGKQPEPLILKFVSEAFKEVHLKDWKDRNPNHRDALTAVVQGFGGEARWRKAIEHLRDEGKLANEPKDIGPLIAEVQRDVLEGPDRDTLAYALLAAFERDIRKVLTTGVPEFYKATLVDSTFTVSDEAGILTPEAG